MKWLTILLATSVALVAMGFHGTTSQQSARDRFLDALAFSETKRDQFAVGDSGKAFGMYQIHRVAWHDVNRMFRLLNNDTHDYSMATNREISTIYASAYIDILSSRLSEALKRPPSYREVYCAWNLGFAGFRRKGLRFDLCPESTKAGWMRLRSVY